ncbi:TetR/AcrR family transcriptional regulator [Actinomadura rugatobispora]|uniref:TetR/AcrR family transcriptional regulator n=1 Tax=Actinomadura rugatobispora TaxID=1994 RepID=A0ABW1A9E7_9ACTN|nr:TetR/AcrR family transcriptional regulator [Actinomadura rugatobispora]
MASHGGRRGRTIGSRSYHHGNLRRVIIDAAVEAIAESGTDAWSLRELARRAGVSHAAPAHHFGDKAGLLTAIAAEGYARFAEALSGAGDDFLEVGVRYVRFATGHPGYFEVMFRPELYRADDPEVEAARAVASGILDRGARTLSAGPSRDEATSIGAWSVVHGFAALWLSGNLRKSLGDSPEAAAREVLHALFDR